MCMKFMSGNTHTSEKEEHKSNVSYYCKCHCGNITGSTGLNQFLLQTLDGTPETS